MKEAERSAILQQQDSKYNASAITMILMQKNNFETKEQIKYLKKLLPFYSSQQLKNKDHFCFSHNSVTFPNDFYQISCLEVFRKENQTLRLPVIFDLIHEKDHIIVEFLI